MQSVCSAYLITSTHSQLLTPSLIRHTCDTVPAQRQPIEVLKQQFYVLTCDMHMQMVFSLFYLGTMKQLYQSVFTDLRVS